MSWLHKAKGKATFMNVKLKMLLSKFLFGVNARATGGKLTAHIGGLCCRLHVEQNVKSQQLMKELCSDI